MSILFSMAILEDIQQIVWPLFLKKNSSYDYKMQNIELSFCL